MGKMITTKEAAKKLGMTQKEVLRRIRNNEIPASKFGWIWVVDADSLPAIRATEWYQRYRQSA